MCACPELRHSWTDREKVDRDTISRSQVDSINVVYSRRLVNMNRGMKDSSLRRHEDSSVRLCLAGCLELMSCFSQYVVLESIPFSTAGSRERSICSAVVSMAHKKCEDW